MRIEGWHIDGFGVFRDYGVRGLPAGLTVLHGPNEAGKSTLLAFLRGVLFGFPDRRQRSAQYPPLRGGRHGGRLFLEGPDGRLTVERYAGRKEVVRIFDEAGRERDEDHLQQWMGGADDRLFRSVFAFSLDELQSLQSLRAEEIRDRIYSSHIAGAGRSARHVMAALDAEASALLRLRGGSRISDLVTTLEEAAVQCSTAQTEAARHSEILRQEQEARARVSELTADLDRSGRRLRLYEALIELGPAFEQAWNLRHELAALESAPRLSSADEARAARLIREWESASGAVAWLEVEASSRSARRDELAILLDEELFARSARAADLMAQIPLQRERLHRLDEARRRLKDIAPPGKQAIAGVPLPEEAVVQGRALAARLTEAAAATRACERSLQAAREERARLELSLDSNPALEPDSLATRDEGLRRLRTLLAEAAAEESAAEALESAASSVQRRTGSHSAPQWAWWTLGIAVSTIVIVACWMVTRDSVAGGMALLVAALAAVLAFLFRTRPVRAPQGREILDRLRAHRERFSDLRLAIASEAGRLGLMADVTLAGLEPVMAELAAQTQQAVRRDAIASALRDAIEDEAAASSEFDAARESGLAAQANWDAWRNTHGLPELAPERLEEVTANARIAGSLRSQYDEARRLVDDLESSSAAWESAARELMTADAPWAIEPGVGSEPLVAAFQDFCALVMRDRETRRQVDEARTAATELDQRLTEARARLKATDAALREILGQAAHTDFQPLLQDARRRSDCEQLLSALEQQITARLGAADRDFLEREIAAADPEAWRAEAGQLAGRLAALRQERDEAIGQLHLLEQERTAIEQSAAVVQAESEVECIRGDLSRATRDWLVASIARGLIERTLRTYTRERQPGVLQTASELFAKVTGGNFVRVLQQDGGVELLAVDRSGRHVRPEELSRGTMEQLFLCLRLGLAAEFARRNASLPLVMDDVLVNFDPERAVAMAACLREFSASHQTLFFTCHPETARMLAGGAAEAGVLSLARHTSASA
ncbi:MAG: AAA family ATPase [Bryobacterales bacterium]|nr:AAA family ATPase [Bryobacterales bacterium]